MVSVATRFRIPYIIERLHSNIFCYNCDGGCRGGTLSRRLPESSSLYVEASFVTQRAHPEVCWFVSFQARCSVKVGDGSSVVVGARTSLSVFAGTFLLAQTPMVTGK
jgi:hypothetical protein